MLKLDAIAIATFKKEHQNAPNQKQEFHSVVFFILGPILSIFI
jgi:hypothetical protein